MIKYRTPNYKDIESVKGQTFETLKPVYRLNPATNELEKTDEVIDIQEIINSCRETCLQTVLERFFPTETTENVVQETYSNMLDDLDYFREMSNVAEEYKIKLGLPADLSIQQVFEKVQTKSNDLKSQLEKLKEQKKDEKKEDVEESK